MDSEDADREELANRVDELEATVSKMLPGRRGVLKGLGAAAIGGAAVGGATGGASGQTAAGQVGTSSEPVDVEAANVNAGSVNTDELTTVNGESFEAILNAVSDNTPILLEQGKTYSGDTTITIPHDTAVYAHGATLDYTGSGVAVETERKNLGTTPPKRIVEWYGGSIIGNSNADIGFLSQDSYGTIIRPQEVRNFSSGVGVKVKNKEVWSEYCQLIGTAFRNNTNHVEFERATGAESGTSSFKATVIRDLQFGPTSGGGVGLSVYGGLYDSEIQNIRCNSGTGDTIIRLYGNSTLNGTVIDHIVTETQGKEDVTIIEIDSIGASNGMPKIGDVSWSDPTGTLTDVVNNSGFEIKPSTFYGGIAADGDVDGEQFNFGSGGGVASSASKSVSVGASSTETVVFTGFDSERRGGFLVVSVGDSQRRAGAIYHVEHFASAKHTESKISEIDTGGFVSIDDATLNGDGDLEVTATETSGYTRNWIVRVGYVGFNL